MTTPRVKCIDCDAMILPGTAAANHGFCAHCVKLTDQLRRERRERQAALASGAAFVPSAEDRAAAKAASEFPDAGAAWSLEPDYYRDEDLRTPREALERARAEPRGHVFVVSDRGGLVSLAFKGPLGICTYRNTDADFDLYAHTDANVARQVEPAGQIDYVCSCCGVGLHTYPSKFHMPRERAIDIFAALVLGESAHGDAAPAWLPCGDITYTVPGHG
jgi:hypothetical protein